MRRAFTLLELLVVIAIMGIMGTASINSYRTMRRGLEESSAVRNASQFVRLAYQRSKIDLVPVNIYFWNETRSVQTDDSSLLVVGRAVAVRRHGRITSINEKTLVDEFGDLDVYGAIDDEGNQDSDSTAYEDDEGMFLYRINGNETSFLRSRVSRISAPFTSENIRLMSDINWAPKEDGGTKIETYGFYLQHNGGITWQKGDAYGLEFGDFELPGQYIFDSSFSTDIHSANREVKVFNFNPLGNSDGGGQTIQISVVRMTSSGSPAAKSLGKTTAPNRQQSDQNP